LGRGEREAVVVPVGGVWEGERVLFTMDSGGVTPVGFLFEEPPGFLFGRHFPRGS
jgi:hypothetical protein